MKWTRFMFIWATLLTASVGMSIVLGILDSDEIAHGPLECLFTWDEELGLNGASSLKPGVLKSKYMINIDSEEDGMFELSNNIGVVLTAEDGWIVRQLPRSFNDSKLDALAEKISGDFEGADIQLGDHFSPWSPDVNSPLIVYSQKVYQAINKKPIELLIVGGGVEASAFTVTYPDMQIVCYGATILDAHTINERIEISTIENCWRYTINLLGQMADCKLIPAMRFNAQFETHHREIIVRFSPLAVPLYLGADHLYHLLR